MHIFILVLLRRSVETHQSKMCECPLRYQSFRLKTFDKNWEHTFLRKHTLANSGFYFIGPRDRVKCFFCEVEIEKWVPGDDVVTEHKKWSPKCPQVNFMSTCDIPIIEIDQSVGRDVCGTRDINGNITRNQQLNKKKYFFLNECKTVSLVFDKQVKNHEFKLLNKTTEDFIVLNKHILEEILCMIKELFQIDIKYPFFHLPRNKNVQIYQTDIDTYKIKVNNKNIALTEANLFSLLNIEKFLDIIYVNYV